MAVMSMLQAELTGAINPESIEGYSPKLWSVIGFVLGESWTNPELRDVSITHDGFVVAHTSDGRAVTIGSVLDVDRNLESLIDESALELEQRRAFWFLYADAVQDLRM